MSTLREQVEALRDHGPTLGRLDGFERVLALIPGGAVLVTEEALAAALCSLDIGCTARCAGNDEYPPADHLGTAEKLLAPA